MHRCLCAFTAAAAGFSPAAAQQELFKLLPSDGGSYQLFGASVAVDGAFALVGAYGDDDAGPGSGSAYLFDVSSSMQRYKLLASDGNAHDLFGLSVAIAGDRAVVGAPSADATGMYSGAVYVFDIQMDAGIEIFKFAPADLGHGDALGHSVAADGRLAIAGAALHDEQGTDAGAAWVFDLLAPHQSRKLLASNGRAGDWFGYSVALSGNRAIIGAPFARTNGTGAGAAYVFDLDTNREVVKLAPSDIQPYDLFGTSVAIGGGRALVGSPDHYPRGAAYLFDLSSGLQVFELVPPVFGADFGQSVALTGDRALIGDPYYADVHVFDAVTGQWLYTVSSPDTMGGGLFGKVVALSGARAIVGAPLDDDLGQSAGAAYVFAIPQSEGSAYCFGDGSGTACPCFNGGGAGEGCANSTGAGALLWAAGSPSASADELVAYANQLPPLQPALLFAGRNAVNQGSGVLFSDGLRCAGGGVVRLGVAWSAPDGTTIWGPGFAGRSGAVAGDLLRFQAWYRDGLGPCGSGSNLSNGLEIGFTP